MNRSPLRSGSLLAHCDPPGQGSGVPFGGMLVQPSAAQVDCNAASTNPPKPSIVPFTHITRSVARVLLCWSWELYSPYLLLFIVAKVPLV